MIDKITEKVPVTIHTSAKTGSIVAANKIADLIRRRNNESKKTVLGLTTGSSLIRIYDELIRLHNEEGLSFKNVITFNVDEYYPMTKDNPESYFHWMNSHLFNHIDIDKENIHIPDGNISEGKINDYCTQYENSIEDAGGIDIQVLDIGQTGHIGFNEPGSQIFSKTRVVVLNDITKSEASIAFGGIDNVPTRAITMGIGTILKARKIILIAWGEGKSNIIQKAVEGEMSDYIPSTFLQEHNNVEFIIDEEAASKLARTKLP